MASKIICTYTPPRPSEHAEQCAVIDWWRLVHKQYGFPEFALFAIPNGGDRHPAVGAKLKAEGVRKGIPDLFLAVAMGGFSGLFIEMKVKPNKPTQEQAQVINYLATAYAVQVCYTADEAIALIKRYLSVPLGRK